MNSGPIPAATSRRPVPRGIKLTGPSILSYGFRPFFLLAASFALVAMAVWIAALTQGWEIGGSYGMLNWHGHEMLFGYAGAVLAGFMLTAVPNWTGRLPVAGWPLLGLVLLWLAGRIAIAAPDWLGLAVAMIVDAAFLPILATVAGIEVIAGKNWKNLKILAGLAALSLANIGFHVSVALSGQALEMSRVAVSVFVMLVAVVGGRIVPSFTRNWLVKAGAASLPKPFGRYDAVALSGLLVALLAWIFAPVSFVTVFLAALAAGLQAVRLVRWRGYLVLAEPLLVALHVGYGFIAIGLAAVALAALGWIAQASALHVLTVGTIGNMTFAVMTRASLGHTGRKLAASWTTAFAYLALAVSAVLRPFAEILPDYYHPILGASGLCWMVAFAIFVVEYGPMLLTPRRTG